MSSFPVNRSAVAGELVAAMKAQTNAAEALTKAELTTSDVAWAKSSLERSVELLDGILSKVDAARRASA